MEDDMKEREAKKQMQRGILLMAFMFSPISHNILCLRKESHATQQRMSSSQFDVDFNGSFACLYKFKVYMWDVL